MIVLKCVYNSSIGEFAPTFNSGYEYTTSITTSGTLKTITYESDTVFTSISLSGTTETSLIKVEYMDLSGVSSIDSIFERCVNLTDVTFVNATTKLTNIAYLFRTEPSSSVNLTFIDCDLSGVTNASSMYVTGMVLNDVVFKNVIFNSKVVDIFSLIKSSKTNSLVIENCSTAPRTSLQRMFYGSGMTEVDLSGLDFTNVTSTHLMFSNSKVEKVVLPKGYFYNLTNLSYMFEGAYYIKEVDLSDFHVMNPQDISYMFYNCKELEKVNLSGIKMDKALSFSHMFYGSSVCKWFDISNLTTSPSNTTNFWKSQAVVENVGMLYCPANVINTIAPLLVSSGRTCNIYYHDAKLEDLTVDSRFNYIYCEEYHGDVISTPDDLELYGLSDVQDTLDLTTGTYTQRVKKWNLAEEGYTLTNVNKSQEAQGYVRFDFRQPQFGNLGNPACISRKGTHINNLGLPNLTEGVCTNTLGRCLGVANNNAFLMLKLKTTDVTSYDKAGLDEWIKANNFTIYYNAVFSGIDSSIKTETYQVNINPLKSYQNGSIQTSSQQLAPTLKTTLPISNKFTTTNLTSGSTYNVYFDGTATKLDAGGTIITNPVSPCEVECGGTTLTIEGTDIQNVRVLETTVKNEVGSVNGATDVELSKVITSDLEVITNGIEFNAGTMTNGNVYEIDNELGTINTKGGHSWGAGSFTSNKTYPKGISLLHIEFDVDMPSNNLMAIINFNNNVINNQYNFRDLTLNNDTATIAQGQQSVGARYCSIVTKGHFSRLMYCFSSQRTIQLDINTGSSAMITASDNSAEGSTSGYTACTNNGVTISNFKIKVIENYPDTTNSSHITSSLRTDSGLTVIWQDIDMSIGQSISTLEQPIKLRSLGTTYDSYNPVTGELVKRIGVSETDGSYSVLSSPVVENISMGKTIENIFNFEEEWINRGFNTSTSWQLTNDGDGIYTLKALQANATARVWFSLLDAEQTVGEELTTIIEVFKNTSNKSIPYWSQIQSEIKPDHDFTFSAGETGAKMLYGKFKGAGRAIDFQSIGKDSEFQFRVTIVRGLYPNIKEGFGTRKIIQVPPHLYTNGQVKVYSDSEVYPTTILNGQSTNNYEINGLNTYNNYTIRYEGECESINLANKSNTQGNNVLVKAGATSGNLTFVNGENIENVMLIESDVREQEINHFTGLQTVEVSRILIENQRNMWSQDYIIDTTLTANYKRISKDYIKVVPNETLYCSTGQAWMDYSDIIQYNENKERVTSTQIFGWATSGMYQDENNIYKNKVQLSENTHYIRICMHGGMLTTASVSRGNFLPPSTLAYNQYQGQYIDLPQPVQLNRIHKENMPYSSWSNVLGQNVKLADGTAYDSYNPITGEYIQRVYKMTLNGDDGIKYIDNWSSTQYAIDDNTLPYPRKNPHLDTVGRYAGLIDVDGVPYGASYNVQNDIFITWLNLNNITINLPRKYTNNVFNQNACKQWLRENPIVLFYELETPIVTQLTPINIPTFEGGILQLITTDGKVFPMIEYSMPTNNRYDTSMWNVGKPITHRNATEIYINGSTTPTIPTETMTFTKEQLSSGSIVINDNGDGLIVLNGDYTGRDIPYFTGMRSVESIEVETVSSPDQPLFGKGGRR